MQETSFSELDNVENLHEQSSYYSRPRPIAAVREQSVSWTHTMRHGSRVQPCSIQLATLENALLLIRDGIDGLIITNDNHILRESRLFSAMEDEKIATIVKEMMSQTSACFDQALVGFDGAWTNYYHWIIFALGRSRMTVQHANLTCPILVPSYAHRHQQNQNSEDCYMRLAYTETVWNESQCLFGLDQQIRPLPDGCYRVKKLLYSWSSQTYPTAITEHPSFYRSVAQIQTAITQEPEPSKSQNTRKICIVRKCEPRIPPEVSDWLTPWLQTQGIELISLETQSLSQQIQIFSESSHIISPHGAGLTNLLLTANRRISVLELNRSFPGEEKLRPWFYILSVNIGHIYWFINFDDQLSQAKLQAGIRRFLDSDPGQTELNPAMVPWADRRAQLCDHNPSNS